ncbi:beta-phosphoglucomutase family hydrolase [Catellatospora bangladeshensis]|uniref:Beta-phosphoglucomutase n=1 Tax=Catellatospora bangladeshensis TaxID=310355 RepID=A0A8J3NN83_9ACTN|nr:beta-phosphoglucomutase family hydrolase [Catellatospora bangladeshensis]GIF84605.1 beta-phosphoglucomutase [Catellatospora bangladeshensis]
MTSPARQPEPGSTATLRADRLDAVVFDLDGVITDTATLHAAAWKQAFDAALKAHAGAAAAAFDIEADYSAYVDGRPRLDGARGFLQSRNLHLPEGTPADPPGEQTVWAVANRKNELFGQLLDQQGVHVFHTSVDLVRRLREAGIATAVVTASRNAARVLADTGLGDLFDTRVDGEDAAALRLPGKPEPATYLEAVRRLSVSPDRAVIIEDALAGVEAGRRGGFGLVVGVDRRGRPQLLGNAGADLVVADLAELGLDTRPRPVPGMADVSDFYAGGQAHSDWVLRYNGYDPVREGLREVLCATGNGYLGTRAAAPECPADTVHYPGSYIAGVYNRLQTPVAGRIVEHEHLVNVPNWLPLRWRTTGGDWFGPDSADLTGYRTELDLRAGVLTRTLGFRDAAGRHTTVVQRRLVHMGTAHLAALDTTFTADGWAGTIEVCSGIDGHVSNANLPEDAPLVKQHLRVESVTADGDLCTLTAVTVQSMIRIAMAARTVVRDTHGKPLAVPRRPWLQDGLAGQTLRLDLAEGHPVTVEKIVATATSRDPAVSEPALAARQGATAAGTFTELLADHERAWDTLWERFDLAVDADDEVVLALRLQTFHLLQALSPHTAQLDAGVPARGLHGEGYHGHVFWDEMFVFPVLNLRLPALSRALLLYRWRRLDAARAAARAAGRTGAMFPWQSGSDGREETPTELYDTNLGRWIPDYSHLQRHVGIAIVYDTWQYYQVTGDVEFLADHGAEMIVEIARYLAGLVDYDPGDDRYGISGVVGPDEYHDAYPGSAEPGLRDNAYTNVMTAWALARALDVIDLLAGHHCGTLWTRLGVDETETRWWERISRRMRVPFHNGVISQFAGYGDLAEFDWATYRTRYGDLVGIDAVLRAEGDTPNRYQLSKQADVLMLLYLLSPAELQALFERLGYRLDRATIDRTVDYYLARVAHGSSLSRIAHSWVQARADREQSWALFTQALGADLADTRGGSTRGGVHLGSMAGTVDLAMRCYTGLETRDDVLYLHPRLPRELRALHVEVLYRGHWVVIDVDHRRLRVGLRPCQAPPIRLGVDGAVHSLAAGRHREFPMAPTAESPDGQASDAPDSPPADGAQ